MMAERTFLGSRFEGLEQESSLACELRQTSHRSYARLREPDGLIADDERLRTAARIAHREFEIVLDDVIGHEPRATPKLAKAASTAAWSTVHGFAKLALDGKFGAADTEVGRREIMATLRQVLDYLWPLDVAKRR